MAPAERDGLSRRGFLGAAGALGAASLASGVFTESASAAGAADDPVVPFHGAHQAGVVTPVQDRLVFAAFDVDTAERAELIDLLWDWTRAAEQLTRGRPVRRHGDSAAAPPEDTGEAVGLSAARLTLTFGFGATLFAHEGVGRFGLGGQRPEALVDLPSFDRDELDPAISGGDLVVQACADDPQVAFHAVRNLTRIARGRAHLRWSQLGFGRTSTTSRSGETPRNLLGFKDGTNNIKHDDREALARHVWVHEDDEPAWMRAGSYLVVRRIRMLLDVWDRAALSDQESTIGRFKRTGAPLGSLDEHGVLDLTAESHGRPVIPIDAHVRLAAPETNDGVRLLRRGYSFTDGIDPARGQLDAGLFFIAYQRDPRAGFIPMQERLGRSDALNEYIRHTGSGLYACPSGVRPGGYVGEGLFR